MTGWFRIGSRLRWHLFAPWSVNNFLLVPACGRELMIGTQHAARLKQASELPPHALLCRGCAASPKARS